MLKYEVTSKKMNIIVTSIIAVLIITLGVIMSIHFINHTNTEVKYSVRDIFEIEHLSDYEESLEGTEGNSTIYKNIGTRNSYLICKADKDFKDINEVNELNIAIDEKQRNYENFEAAAYYLSNADTREVKSTADGISALNSNIIDGFVVAYEDIEGILESNPNLKVSNVLVEMVPSILLLGGTHPYEPSGMLTATIFLENLVTERGVFYLINETNKSALNYEQEAEARPETFTIDVVDKSGNKIGEREFKIGSRFTHLTLQWPTSDVYVNPSGQQLTATEARNLNRVYPGAKDGNYTERVAYAIVQCIKQNNITMEVDLHEAGAEYSPNHAVIYHQDTSDIAVKMQITRAIDPETGAKTKVDFSYEESPLEMHGLSHREIGDYTNAYAILVETPDAYEGRIHGAMSEDLIEYLDGNDKFYEYLREHDENSTDVQYLQHAALTINERVAMHTFSILNYINAFNEVKREQRTSYTQSYLPESERHQLTDHNYCGKFILNDVPTYHEILKYTIGAYLKLVD